MEIKDVSAVDSKQSIFAERILLAVFIFVTMIYSFANPFLIIITNILWAGLYEKAYVKNWAVLIVIYILPVLPVLLTAISWYQFAKKRFQMALLLLFLPGIIFIGFIFLEPLFSS